MMEILKDKGTKITIFGQEYRLVMSLTALEKIEEEISDLEKLMLNYKTVPVILKILINEYCENNPDAKNITLEELKKNLVPSDIKKLEPLLIKLLIGEESEKNG